MLSNQNHIYLDLIVYPFIPDHLASFFNSPAATKQAFASQFYRDHPLVHHCQQTHDGRAHKISDFLSEQQLHRIQALYEQYLYRMDMEGQMEIVLLVSSSHARGGCQKEQVIPIMLHRSQRGFSEHDRLVLNLLRPHLLQAYHNAQALTRMHQELAWLNQTVEQSKTIVLTKEGKIRLMTQNAWELLEQYFQCSDSSKQPSCLPEILQGWVQHQISLLTLNEDIPPFKFPLQVEREGKQLIVHFIPKQSEEQYLLLFEEQSLRSFSPSSLELLGLTRREAEVLFWAAQDKTNAEIAKILICSDKTVKKHLEHIYSKLGVQTRTAAVVRALENLGMLN